MSPAILRQIVEKRLDRLVAEDRKWLDVLYAGQRQLNSGFYDADYVKLMCQNWGKKSFDLADSYCFLQLHAEIHEGLILGCSIDVGSQPLENADVEGNNQRLQDLPPPFTAHFAGELGGAADDDGLLEWNQPIEVSRNKLLPSVVDVDPGTAPLEVGSTDIMTTFWHLIIRDWRLARWPYDSTQIALLIRAKYLEMGCRRKVSEAEILNELSDGD